MEFTLKRTVQIIAFLLIAAALTQAIYTGIYIAREEGLVEFSPPRGMLWGTEGLLFTLLAAFAGSALVEAKRFTLGFSAIAMSAVLNVVQVGVGLTMFVPFREVATAVEATAPAAGAIVAFSFMVYNAAKILLGLAAVVFGMACLQAGGKVIGPLTAAVGVIAMVANTLSMAAGRGVTGDIPLAGGTGVLATLLLAVCLLGLFMED
ncbi:MAG: thiamine biosynthesis protein ThiC [Erythrobacter sp.]|nr:thiamine biosynthesis protein ThiC [Erythrobacter sp.]